MVGGALLSGLVLQAFAEAGGVGLEGAAQNASEIERGAAQTESICFVQRRADPTFSDKSEVPEYLRGRSLNDVVADLKSGKIEPEEIEIQVFRDPGSGKLVSINTRGLAALSDAGFRLINVKLVQPPDKSVLRRLAEGTFSQDFSLPGPHVPITLNRKDVRIIRVI